MFSTLKPRIMPILSGCAGKHLAWKQIEGIGGSPISLPGALQFVGDFKQRAWEAERTQCIPKCSEICKSAYYLEEGIGRNLSTWTKSRRVEQ
jgi:hypothetical protein